MILLFILSFIPFQHPFYQVDNILLALARKALSEDLACNFQRSDFLSCFALGYL